MQSEQLQMCPDKPPGWHEHLFNSSPEGAVDLSHRPNTKIDTFTGHPSNLNCKPVASTSAIIDIHNNVITSIATTILAQSALR